MPTHILGPDDGTGAHAWLIDSWGRPHGLLGDEIAIGRHARNDIVISHASVSRSHAELTRREDGWHVRDLGSRNGVSVDGVAVHRGALLCDHALLEIGQVPFFVRTNTSAMPLVRTSYVETTDVERATLFHCRLQEPGNPDNNVWLLASDDSDGDQGSGRLVTRGADSQLREMRLTPLNFQLLKALCEQKLKEGADLAGAGCLSAKTLARRLPFRSEFADDEDVRQRIRRVRKLLERVGLVDVIGSIPRHGYHLTWVVERSWPT